MVERSRAKFDEAVVEATPLSPYAYNAGSKAKYREPVGIAIYVMTTDENPTNNATGSHGNHGEVVATQDFLGYSDGLYSNNIWQTRVARNTRQNPTCNHA